MSDNQTLTDAWIGEPVWRNQRSVAVSGVLAATIFGLNLVVGGGLVYATGIPGLSAVVSGLFVPLVLSLGAMMTGRPGAVTLIWTVYAILAIPTPLNGPPGIYKVLIGLAAGLAFEVPVVLARGRRWSYYVGLLSYITVNLGAFLLAFELLDLPGADEFRGAVYAVAFVFTVEGLISVTVAHSWYRRRLVKLPLVQRLHATKPSGE